MTTKINYKFEYTNTCSCITYDEVTEQHIESNYCFGSCWDDTVMDFENITEDLFNDNETNWWIIQGLKLWNGDINGFVHAKTPEDLLRGMTVNSEWIIEGTIYTDRIEYSLSHHDAPMGSRSVARIITEEQREEWGLY